MDHEHAERVHAAERFALRDMPPDEAEAFELHFFGCALCAAELETLRALAVNGRTLQGSESGKVLAFPSSHRSVVRPGWWPVATAAGWLLAATLGWQQFSRPAAAGPEAMATYALRNESRGEPNAVSVPASVRRFALYFDLVWDARPSSYQIRIDGPTHSSLSVPAPAAGQPLFVLLDRAGLAPGLYKLTISDSSGTALTELAFSLQL